MFQFAAENGYNTLITLALFAIFLMILSICTLTFFSKVGTNGLSAECHQRAVSQDSSIVGLGIC